MKTKNRQKFESLGTYFANNPSVYIYGAGKIGLEMYKYLKPLNCVKGFLASNFQDVGKVIADGLTCHHIDELDALPRNFLIITASEFPQSQETMMRICIKHGHLQNVFSHEMFQKVLLGVFAFYACGIIYTRELPYSITSYCTLRCKACNHMTSLNSKFTHFGKEKISADFSKYLVIVVNSLGFFKCV
jgi:hypothetical protein